MPVMRASRPDDKQRIGDLLYERLKDEHGKLAGKIVGMLLEGLPHEGLALLCEDTVELKKLISLASPMLEIQRLELSLSEPTAEGLKLLELLGGALARTTDTIPHRANACWSLADLSMEPPWRVEVGKRRGLLEVLAKLLVEGDVWEKKNAALCFGNLCCDCLHNQTIVGNLSRGGITTVSALVAVILESPDENSRIFSTLAINNLACLLQNAQTIAMSPGAISGLVKMLTSSTEEGQQCGALALANIAANDSQNIFEIGLQEGVVSGLIKIIKQAKVQSARETAVWALAIVSCNDEWNVLPQVWEHDGTQVLCDVLHQARWKSSARCVQYAATIIQLIIETHLLTSQQTMQGHLVHAETTQYIGALLVLMESPEVVIKEFMCNAIVSLVNKSSDEVIQTVLLHPSAMKSIIAAISPPQNNSQSISEQASANISQMLADHISLFEIYHEERFSVIKYILSLSRSSTSLQKRLTALSSSLKARFTSVDRRSVFDAASAGLCISIDREDVLCSAVRHLGRVPISVLLQRGYKIEFKSRGRKEDGSDYGGLRRTALTLIAKELFSEENGYVSRCVSDDGEEPTGLLQITTSRRIVESQEGQEMFRLMGRLIGLALAENIPLGIPLASGFFKLLATDGIFPENVNLEDLMEIDQALHRSLATTLPSMPDSEMRQALECMTFSVPSRTQQAVTLSREQPTVGTPVQPRRTGLFYVAPDAQPLPERTQTSQAFVSPLRPGGASQPVTPSVFDEYRDLVLHKRIVEDCAMQMELVRAGLYEVVPIGRLSLLSCSELRLALHGNPYVDPLEWKQEAKYELPYTKESEVVHFFWKYVEEISQSERLDLLRWMTGLFCLPTGGFSSLSSRFRISKDHGSLDRLPSVSTCSFTLFLPEYGSFDMLSSKLKTASDEFSFGRA